MRDIVWPTLVACALAACGLQAHAAPVAATGVVSPDGRVRVEFSLYGGASAGVPCYGVSYNGRELVRPSGLGLDLAPAGPLGRMRVLGVSRRESDTTYAVFPGKTSRARDHFREATVSLEETSGAQRRMDLVFRAYDDGVAFRYRIPRQPALRDFVVRAEHSAFAVADNPRSYALPVDSFRTPYEFFYRTEPLEVVPHSTLVGLPLLLEYPDHTSLAITEADLTDYAGMYLSPSAGGLLESRLSPRLDDSSIAVRAALPHDTPWRVLMIGSSPGRLIESELVNNLNPPCALADTSWIKTGKTAFPWWNGYDGSDGSFKAGLNTPTMKHYIDFCAAHGIEYHSLDGLGNTAWYGGPIGPYQGADITRSLPEIDLPGVIAYARQKGVRLRFWMHCDAARARMHTAFPVYEKWGIEGVMVDFFDRDDQETVNFVHDLVALAAQHHLTVTLHGIYKPTGLSRTYPNLLNYEAVRNLEYDKWDPLGSPPQHEVTLPFIRMLAGPLDYHHGSFRNVTEEQFRPRMVAPVTMGTRARQLARYVVYEDYLPMVADSPAAYAGQPGLEAIAQMPTAWDETRFLNGEVGRYLTIARRRGREWWIGSMTDGTARSLDVRLRFLGGGTWTAHVYRDDLSHPDEPTRMVQERSQVRASETLTAEMCPAGGWLVRFTPAR